MKSRLIIRRISRGEIGGHSGQVAEVIADGEVIGQDGKVSGQVAEVSGQARNAAISSALNIDASMLDFVPGNPQLQMLGRAYITFSDSASLLDFHKRYHEQYIIEFAPYQKLPPPAVKDLLAGTIENDPAYIDFLQSLQTVSVIDPHEVELAKYESILNQDQPKTTPLLDELRARRQKKIELLKKKRERIKELNPDKPSRKSKKADKKKANVVTAIAQKSEPTPPALGDKKPKKKKEQRLLLVKKDGTTREI
jgi:hypothetical protein